MPIDFTERTQSTLAQLISRIRKYGSDNKTDAAQQKWSDDDWKDFYIAEVGYLYSVKANRRPSEYKAYADFDYPASTTRVDLSTVTTTPSGKQENFSIRPILYAEDVTNPDRPILVSWVSPAQAEFYKSRSGDGTSGITKRAFTVYDQYLELYPEPDAIVPLRIHYIKNPFALPASDSDYLPWPTEYQDLVCLGAARRGLGIDEKFPPTLEKLYYEQLKQFEIFAVKFRTSQTIKDNRRYRG